VDQLRTISDAPPPASVLYRIGYPPDPLAWPPRALIGTQRFDDPNRRFRVLYAAERRLPCFVEVLQDWRPDLQALSALAQRATQATAPLPPLALPRSWRQSHLLGRFKLAPNQRWLDVRRVQTREELRRLFAPAVLQVGLEDFDGGAIRSLQRSFTQAIAGWAFNQGFQGIVYTSRFDDAWTCWAIFEGAAIQPVGVPRRIGRSDPDLALAAALLRIGVG
jgi:hypothetical protein